MGFIQLAKGRARLFATIQTVSHGLHFGLIWIGLQLWGLQGVAIAFFCLYVFHFVIIGGVARSLSGFRFEIGVYQLLMILLPVLIAVFIGSYILPRDMMALTGTIAMIGVGVYCIRQLLIRLESDHRLVRLLDKWSIRSWLVK
jgi:PST family polysaccharide transporter